MNLDRDIELRKRDTNERLDRIAQHLGENGASAEARRTPDRSARNGINRENGRDDVSEQTISAFGIERGTRVSPVDLNTANILGRRKFYQPGVGTVINTDKFLPETGTVVGHAGRMGDYVLVRWDGDPCSAEDTVHWRNLRPEKGEPFAA